jgi:hypothetical protein
MRKERQDSVAFSPQVKYSDWATATCRRNLVPTFADRGVSRGQRGGTRTVVNLSFLDRSRHFSLECLLIYPDEAEWTPFQTHCYAENLVAPGIEPRTSELGYGKFAMVRKWVHVHTSFELNIPETFLEATRYLIRHADILSGSVTSERFTLRSHSSLTQLLGLYGPPRVLGIENDKNL